MPFELGHFEDETLEAGYLEWLVQHQHDENARVYGRLWSYFRNPLTAASGLASGAMNGNSRPYFQAQEAGLPARITGVERVCGERLTDLRRKEVVIENDIGWRVGTMVDYLFGKPVKLRSTAADEWTASAVEQVAAAMLEANGGVAALQEMALVGAVYGFVDVVLRTAAGGLVQEAASESGDGAGAGAPRGERLRHDDDPRARCPRHEDGAGPSGDRSKSNLGRAIKLARLIQLETVEAPRVLPVLDEDDCRQVRYWVQRYQKHPPRMTERRRGFLGLPWGAAAASPASVDVVEILGANWWQRYEDGQLVEQGANSLGQLPVVHIQNVSMGGCYEGLGDVEGLIPLQDELNTRLSDRAHRVTYQSFKMYLGKGIDDFLERPVGPGQMWATQNASASIEEFGSDSGSPSESAHIEEIRQAMDKVSGVTPLAAGLIRGNVGYLSSSTALKVLLSGLVSRTEKKRLTYGAGLAQIVELALCWLDGLGVLRTRPAERRVEVVWPDVLPADEAQKLANAQIKAQLGVPRERVLAELGY